MFLPSIKDACTWLRVCWLRKIYTRSTFFSFFLLRRLQLTFNSHNKQNGNLYRNFRICVNDHTGAPSEINTNKRLILETCYINKINTINKNRTPNMWRQSFIILLSKLMFVKKTIAAPVWSFTNSLKLCKYKFPF